MALCVRSTDGLNGWDRLGMLDAAAAVVRQHVVDAFEPHDNGNPDE